MTVYLDTNIIIDILERRYPHYENSNKVFQLIVDGVIDGIIATSAITDIFYLLRKAYKDTQATLNVIFQMLDIIEPVDTLASDIYTAAGLGFNDFEDAVIVAIALREEADCIITRNTVDFSLSTIPAVTPDVFLADLENQAKN
jgi:predicted nucleic acid-binding protein